MKKENSSNCMNSSVRMTNIYKKRIEEIANFLHLTRYRTLIQKAIFQLQEEEQTMDSVDKVANKIYDILLQSHMAGQLDKTEMIRIISHEFIMNVVVNAGEEKLRFRCTDLNLYELGEADPDADADTVDTNPKGPRLYKFKLVIITDEDNILFRRLKRTKPKVESTSASFDFSELPSLIPSCKEDDLRCLEQSLRKLDTKLKECYVNLYRKRSSTSSSTSSKSSKASKKSHEQQGTSGSQ